MKRKYILALCVCVLVLAAGITCVFLATSQGAKGASDEDPGGKISSDGTTYLISSIDDVELAAKIGEGGRLPAVGDRETLLKLLLERGTLNTAYNNGVLRDAVDGDGSAPMAPPAASSAATSGSAPDAEIALTAPGGAADSGGGSAYSGTNEQVSGVNEGDIVKTDGRYIYSMSQYDNKLRIVKANGAGLEVVSTIIIEEIWGAEFYLIGGDKLVVIGNEYLPVDALYRESGLDGSAGSASDSPDVYWIPQNNYTTLMIYDISDPSSPTEIRRVSMDGSGVSTRVIGSVVYMVTVKYVWGVPANQADSPLILPYCRDTAADDAYSPIAFDRIYYVPDSQESNYILIGVVDINSGDAFAPEAYLGAGTGFYMSRNAMYITCPNWGPDVVNGNMVSPGGMKTDVMRFAIDGDSVTYSGMGSVDGFPINQYSMDEYNGYFRIATTDRMAGTYVTILDAPGMRVVGRTKPLAPGEMMQSMRFMGDMGYIVTFQNMDPLFTVDLSDPRAPVVLGELKIPGFSQYLHPVGEGLLLGIGRDTQEVYTRDRYGVETVVGFQDVGLKVSLFDVSDPVNPREIDVLSLGEGWAEVSYNPRALMCDASRHLYGFVMEGWNNRNGAESSALVLGVANGRLSNEATLVMRSGYMAYGGRLCFIGDTLYLAHSTGVIAYDYSSFTQIGSVSF